MANCVQCGRQLPALSFGKKLCQWCVQHEAAQRSEEDEDAKQAVMPAPWVRREASISLTHVIFGANVAVVMRNAATNVTELVIPNAGHWLMEEQSDATISAVSAFLSAKQ